MIDRPLEIPEQSGEVLLVPAATILLAAARATRDRLADERVRVGSIPLGEWRAQAREEILALARAYTAGLEVGPVPEGELLLCTGHQPVFVHPGIWVKYLLLDRLAAQGHTGLALTVDSDAMEEAAVAVPKQAGAFLERRREILRVARGEEPYEGQPAPAQEEWSAFLARLDRHLQSVSEEGIHQAWRDFRALGCPAARSYAAFVTVLRRRYEGPRHFLEVPISLAAETAAFRLFFLHITREAARFRRIHNAHLAAYREHQHIRTDAQPFANLEEDGDWIELPFWTVAGGRRQRLFVDPRRETLSGPATPERPLPDDPTDATWATLALRPRAITLTAFSRLGVADLFIHGVSGGRYDRVTDAVIVDFFDVAPPVYATTSATLHLPFTAAVDPETQRQAVARLVQEARHNPERLLDDPTPAQRAWIEEKWRLIRQLEAPGLTRRDRRAATRAIRTQNELLRAALADRLAALEAALAGLDERRGPTDAAGYRAYPYFLYRPGDVEGLVTKMMEAGNGQAGEGGH